MYKKPQSETGNKRLREPHKTRSAKRTSAAEQKREQRTHAAPKNSSSLSSLATHPTSLPIYSRPVRCCPPQLDNWNREPGQPGRKGSRCLTRQEQVASYSRALYKYDCCHGYHAEGCRVAPPYLFSWLLVLWGSLSLLFPVSDWGFLYTHSETSQQLFSRSPWCFLFALIQNKHSLSLFTFLFIIHLFHVYSSFFFWCLVQSGLFLFLKLAFLCYSSTALAGGYSCVTLTLTLVTANMTNFIVP